MIGRRSVLASVRRATTARTVAALAGGFPLKRRKRNKFHVAPKIERTWQGIVFASKGEMQRHKQLLLAQDFGKIKQLERQVTFVLVTSRNGKALLRWVVDWTYWENDQKIAEDFTGVMTSLKRSNIRICASMYPDVTIRISSAEGTGRSRRIVVVDCVNGKVPK